MGRFNNQKIAQETIEITKNGFYEKDGERHNFSMDSKCLDEVMAFSPERVDDIKNDYDDFFEKSFNRHAYCEYRVVNMDSYEANYVYALQDRALVMNFANAHHPGGGFIAGASAQEESLCRCSSLFASINSENARDMYDFNNEEPDQFDSDYMLISPYVEVFRYANGELRDDSFTTAVLTIPAPNLYGMAEGVDKNQLKIAMKEKVRSFMMVSARYVYDTLVLGAWGCGAFGHDAKDVAQYFKEVIEEEAYYQFFGKIIFAVYDRTPDQYNYQIFLKAFGEHGLWKDEGNNVSIISAHYKSNTKDENGDAVICEEAIIESLENLKSNIDDYLENNIVDRIEIIK